MPTPSPQNTAPPSAALPTYREALRTWAYVGLNSFGGPAGQIAVMHRVLVDEKKWLSESRFLHALNYCMLLPGPEAQQLAVYSGWLLHGVRGGVAAGLLFILPGVLVMLGLSYLYVGYHDATLVQHLFFGLKAAVLAVVVEAVLRIGRRALKTRFHIALAALAFVALYFFHCPFPLVVGGAALIGWLQQRFAPAVAPPPAEHAAIDALLDARAAAKTTPGWAHAARVLAVCGGLWALPLLAALLFAGPASVYVQAGAFFSKAAVVTFGGAYAVLSYIAQAAVDRFHWMQPGEMLDGLALAETTPGPLILVVQFVGFVAAARNPGALPPMLAGTLGALLTTWVTFAPCFLWIFLGAPYIEALRHHRGLNSALSAITAAVVGVILNLAVWFALHALFAQVSEIRYSALRFPLPVFSALDWPALALAAAAMLATFRFHVGMLKVLAASALAGLALRLALG